MKALTLTQPWASLVAIGAKRNETRSWKTPYRGLIAIHAAKGFPGVARDVCYRAPFRETLRAHFPSVSSRVSVDMLLPISAVVAVARLVEIEPTGGLLIGARPQPEEPERSFGDYGPNRFIWRLAEVVRLTEPVPCRGALGLWTLHPAEVAAVEGRMPR